MKFGKTEEQRRLDSISENFVETKFAWFPRKLENGQWILFEKYYSIRSRRVRYLLSDKIITYYDYCSNEHCTQDVEEAKKFISAYTVTVSYLPEEATLLSAFLDKKIKQFEDSLKPSVMYAI